MTLGASTITDAVGGWAQGCLVLLIGVWLFLALLGIRNSRFPYRLFGGAVFVIGSAMWIGLHPALADAWHLDAGRLGWWAESGLAGRLADGSFMLNGIGALLLLCSLVGFLIAIDWLPLWPLAPLLDRLEALFGAAARPNPAAAAAVATLPTALLRASAAATLEREPKVRPVAPPPPAAAPAAAVALPPAAAVASTVEEPPIAEAAAAPAEVASEPSPTDWARFRPRAPSVHDEAATSDMAMDNAATATHNSSTSEGESRASIDDAQPSGSPESEEKDPPVLARDTIEEDPTRSTVPPDLGAAADSSSTAVVDESTEDAVDEEAPDAETVAEELSPRRKKEDEPSEEPGEEPGEEPDEEGDDDAEDDEAGDDDLTEDEEAEDEDEEDVDEDEDWEEDDEEEEGEEEEDDEDEDEKEDDEDWDDEDEDEDEDEDDDKDDDKDEDEKDENWDGDEKGASLPPAPVAAAEPAILEVDGAAAEPAASEAESAVPEATVLEDADDPPAPVEVVADADVAADAESAAVAIELPAHLFSDLPQDERITLVRAVELLLGAESISLSRLQRELGITYYAAARVFERLEKDGFIAAYSGSLARAVQVTREQWEARRRTS